MGLNFQSIKGDTFEEVTFELLLNDEPYSLEDAIIRMQLRKEYGGIPFLSLTSVANAGITITDDVIAALFIAVAVNVPDAADLIFTDEFAVPAIPS